MKIIHLSDLHFHTSNKKNRKALETLKKVKEKFADHYIVVTGDIVDDGHVKQYDNAFKALKSFKGRIFIAPGNHDFGAVGNFYSLEKARLFDEKLSIPLGQGGTFVSENKPVVNVVQEGNDSAMFIALDTNLETNHPFDFACGKIGEKQLSDLSAILNNPTIPGMKKILFFHHHPFMRNDPFMELKDAKRLARLIYNKVDIVLFGHKHEMAKWENRWGVDYVLASDNSPGKAKVNRITIQDSVITMDYAPL
jgi:3',5'-cyclic AMP phosphodiesterase CpdA